MINESPSPGRRTATLVFLCAAFSGAQESAPASRPRVLFLTHSAAFKHEVVTRPAPDRLSLAEEALVAAASAYDVVATQDCAAIAAARLKDYAAVAFYTTGELPVSGEDRAALVDWVERGGAFVGIHGATDTYDSFPPWARLVGAVFDGHPWHEKVGVLVEQPTHPAAAHLGARFEITDEIYQFKDWRPEPVSVVLRLDPASVELAKGKRADRDYALAWARLYGAGRVFYTALGHRPEVWRDERFLKHVVGGLDWATGRAKWSPAPPPGAIVPEDGFSSERPYSLHAEIDLAAPGADEASIQFEMGRMLSAAGVRFFRRDDSLTSRVAVDVFFSPDRPGSTALVRSDIWINGVLFPEMHLHVHAIGGHDKPWKFHVARRDLWKNLWIVKR
jgi:uncharacterized protein